MALMTPTRKAVPILRQGTWVYMTPTVVPYKDSHMQIFALLRSTIDPCKLRLELELIGALISAFQGPKVQSVPDAM